MAPSYPDIYRPTRSRDKSPTPAIDRRTTGNLGKVAPDSPKTKARKAREKEKTEKRKQERKERDEAVAKSLPPLKKPRKGTAPTKKTTATKKGPKVMNSEPMRKVKNSQKVDFSDEDDEDDEPPVKPGRKPTTTINAARPTRITHSQSPEVTNRDRAEKYRQQLIAFADEIDGSGVFANVVKHLRAAEEKLADIGGKEKVSGLEGPTKRTVSKGCVRRNGPAKKRTVEDDYEGPLGTKRTRSK